MSRNVPRRTYAQAGITPRFGDVIHCDWGPTVGGEIRGHRYGVVVTPEQFNKCGLVWVCPISQGVQEYARSQGMLVSLMGSGTRLSGNVLVHQLKSLHWRDREASLEAKMPQSIMDEITAIIEQIIF